MDEILTTSLRFAQDDIFMRFLDYARNDNMDEILTTALRMTIWLGMTIWLRMTIDKNGHQISDNHFLV